MTPDKWIAGLQLLLVLLTGIIGFVAPELQAWIRVAIATVGAILAFVFGVGQGLIRFARLAITRDNWIAILQIAVVLLTAISGLSFVVGTAIEPWIKVAIVFVGAVLTYIFGVTTPIKAAFQRALKSGK